MSPITIIQNNSTKRVNFTRVLSVLGKTIIGEVGAFTKQDFGKQRKSRNFNIFKIPAN